MKYYKLRTSRNRKEVGVKPQSQEGYLGDIQQDFIPWQGIIDFDFKLPEPNLEKKAKIVSLLDVAFIHSRFLVIDETFLNFFKNYNIGNYQYWKIKTWSNNSLVNKYNLFFLNNTKEKEYINFKESEFLIGKLGDWRNPNIRNLVYIEHYDKYLTLKNDLRKTKDKQRIRCNKIVFDLSNINEDMFRIMNIPFENGYFISEKLKNAIQANNFTGMAFTEVSELDKVEVIY